MRIMTGQVARKNNFWNRKKEIDDIWYKLDNGEHILLVAPRRVGKTSIMYNLFDNPKEDYIVLYIDTESANSEKEFWKKLFHRLCEEDFLNTFKNKSTRFYEKLKSININEISTKGIKLGNSFELDYIKALKKIFKEIDKNKKLIIMFDEFAQTIENIIKYETEQEAKSLLSHHRELRQDQKLCENVVFIYAGSIGLESISSKIDSIGLINDLSSIKVSPLKNEEAKDFIKKLTNSNNIKIDNTQIEYILEKVEWLIPFYIQLIIDELRRKDEKIEKKDIDETFSLILDNRNHFEHWHTRLKSFIDNEYKFAKEVLSKISEENTLKSNEIINIASKHLLDEEEAKEIIRSLKYDGYINNQEDIKIYRFNSPILREWWYQNVAN